MSTTRLFHIVAALVVVFICTNNVVQGRPKHGGKKNPDDKAILTVATFILENTPPGRIVRLGQVIDGCMTTSDKKHIQEAVEKSISQLQKSVETGNGKKVNARDFNDDDEEEDFEERLVNPLAFKKTLNSVKSFFDSFSGNQLNTYAAALKKLGTSPVKVRQEYINDFINIAAQCAAGQTIVKRTELDDDNQDSDDDDEGY